MTPWPTIRARFFVGRPGVTYAQVVTPDDLAHAVARIESAYSAAAAARPWLFHVLALRHDLRWTERLVRLLEGQDAVAEMSRAMEGCRGCNEAPEEFRAVMLPTEDLATATSAEPATVPPAAYPPAKPPPAPPRKPTPKPSAKEPVGKDTNQGVLI
jgi:hypothetical protein